MIMIHCIFKALLSNRKTLAIVIHVKQDHNKQIQLTVTKINTVIRDMETWGHKTVHKPGKTGRDSKMGSEGESLIGWGREFQSRKADQRFSVWTDNERNGE